MTSRGAPSQPIRLGAALFLLSTATVLFTLSLFKLLSFFIMPSLFFDLLFIGFPVGALIGVRWFLARPESFRKALWILQGIMVLSVFATLACKHFDYLRAHLFEVRIDKLLGQMGTFTALFIPFFCAYGLSEYIGYQVGRQALKGRMPLVYSLYLFGAAFAYVAVQFLLPLAGISRLLASGLLLVAGGTLLLTPRGALRAFLAVECAALLALLVLPGVLEQRFLELYKGSGFQSTADYARRGYDLEFQKWGRYSLTEIMAEPSLRHHVGFYNDLMQWEYSPLHGFHERSLGMVPLHYAPQGGSIAIIGAGGGRQVKYALEPFFSFQRIVALELEPAVFEAVRGPLRERFASVYEDPRVEPVLHEARGYMEATEERFDLIYLPSVGGYPQMMLEPGNMIRTVDAYRTLRERLTDRGILAIWYPAGLDPRGILTRQYVRTLSSDELGMHVRAFWSPQEFLILAARSPQTHLPESSEIRSLLLRDPGHPEGPPLPPNPHALPHPFFVLPDPHFKPISDNQPFLAGNVRHIFSLRQVYTLFAIAGFVLFAAGATLFLVLRKSGDPGVPGRSYASVAGLAFLIGANFLVFEHFVILSLFKKIYVFQDALVLGAVSFLIVSGLGSILIRPRWRPRFQLLGVAAVVAATAVDLAWPEAHPALLLALVVPVAFVTGSFFPSLFEACAHNPLAVFAMDAVGAGFGSMLAFFLPIAFGFHVFFPAGAVLFVVTAAATFLFFRAPRELPAEAPGVVRSGEAP